MPSISKENIVGAILADGTSRRMQSVLTDNSNHVKNSIDKSQLLLGGKPLIDHVSDRSMAQVETLIINGNRPIQSSIPIPTPTPTTSQNSEQKKFTYVPDDALEEFLKNQTEGQLTQPPTKKEEKKYGPLAGVTSAMLWMEQQNKAEKKAQRYQWLASFPCDTPFIPKDFVARLSDELFIQQQHRDKKVTIAYAIFEDNKHPLCAIWSIELLPQLLAALQNNQRKVFDFIHQQNFCTVEFPESENKISDPFFNINTPDDLTKAELILKNG